MDVPIEPGGIGPDYPTTAPVPPAPEVTLTENAQLYLDQTRPWARFISVMIFITVGFTALAAFAVAAIGLVSSVAPPFMGSAEKINAVGAVLLGLFYMLMAVLYVPPGIFLSRYASGIRNLRDNPSALALEDLIKQQKSFWRYIGILSLIALVVCIVIVAFAIVMAVFGSIMMRRT